jgi:putative redox protein
LTVASNARAVTVRWREGLLFDGAPPGRAPLLVDGDGGAAASPVELLLVAAATCAASDVVVILRKQRVALRSLEVAVEGTRRDTEPRRYTAIHFRWTLAGEGADETKARRAIDLSLEKYCSVVASLAPDIRITYAVAIP